MLRLVWGLSLVVAVGCSDGYVLQEKPGDGYAPPSKTEPETQSGQVKETETHSGDPAEVPAKETLESAPNQQSYVQPILRVETIVDESEPASEPVAEPLPSPTIPTPSVSTSQPEWEQTAEVTDECVAVEESKEVSKEITEEEITKEEKQLVEEAESDEDASESQQLNSEVLEETEMKSEWVSRFDNTPINRCAGYEFYNQLCVAASHFMLKAFPVGEYLTLHHKLTTKTANFFPTSITIRPDRITVFVDSVLNPSAEAARKGYRFLDPHGALKVAMESVPSQVSFLTADSLQTWDLDLEILSKTGKSCQVVASFITESRRNIMAQYKGKAKCF